MVVGRVSESIAALRSEVTALLSPPANPNLAPTVEVSPVRVSPGALGGFIGIEASEERFARRLEAEVTMRHRGGSSEAVAEAQAQAALDLVGADPVTLRRRGILRVARRAGEAAPGDARERAIRFDVTFEHRPEPDAGGGTIDEVRQGMAVTRLTGSLRLRYAHDFRSDPLADFTAVDGQGSGGPGAWSWDEETAEVRQTSNLGGGSGAPTAAKQGAYLVLNAGAAGGPVGDFVLDAELRLDDPDGDAAGSVGFVFRYRDPANFGFALVDLAGWRLLGLRGGGAGSQLQEGGSDTMAGLAPGVWHRLRLIAEGDRFELHLDEALALAGRDDRLGAPGAVGFFCRRAAGARFGRFRLLGS